jgi:hypothetical protein
VRWTGLHWLDGLSNEATKGMRAMLFWTTVVFMIATITSMVLYHVSGRDVRADFQDLLAQLSAAHLAAFGIAVAKLVGLAVGVFLAFRLIRRLRVYIEAFVHRHLPDHVDLDTALPPSTAQPSEQKPGEKENQEDDRRAQLEETIRRWFTVLERFALALVGVGALWLAGRAVGIPDIDGWGFLVLSIMLYFMVARLLTLGCRTMFHVFTNLGNRHLKKGSFRRYWERVARLFPFGEKCFEAAVWIFAATQCAKALEFIAFVGKYGTAIVECIGIFFATRVAIELLHVFINEAFGMYKEDGTPDQKGQTLVPLLESVT